ncbi:E3 ubiquitin protein ligase RIE1-like [Cynara cardunculus var. scolymus]|uniref:E3 ubiquitin protein ligase RIE1-like n=1 Tax=Cynara cardunculus var. scolymus TaxID=59895 RepID=UPI000D6252D3|nr:E3 ubiquitin protein ligase RIE1-like [Cynara cardunculus var. scolymus]XP_024988412.1 E3 ubiquitin protein ligase RIE1-like [Cynara cardunculus var. scolymus]
MAEMANTAREITTVPLLTSRQDTRDSPSAGGDRTTTMLSLLLGLFAGRRGASMLVRQTAARQLEDWRADWGYSLPVVVLDMTWNFVFVVVSVVMLFWTAREKPNVPLRLWICVYSLQCAIHIVLVWLEYRRRNRGVAGDQTTADCFCFGHSEDSDGSDVDLENYTMIGDALRWENINTTISYMWWVVGFCWLLSDFKILLHSAPRLFWLALAFLAIDVFFAFIAFVLACLLGLAVCFCFPCIIAILCIIAGREGASETDISVLPKYRFEAFSDEEQSDVGAGRMIPIETNGRDFSVGRVLLAEDADCCICLSPYEDGVELLSLLCNHHFHATCIVKWLKMNATCPLCKHHIRRNEQV